MKRYFKLFFTLVKNNLVRDMEYRANFFMHFVLDGLWVFLQIAIIQIYFQYTNSIFGWSKLEIFALAGAFRVIKGINDGFLRANVHSIPDRVDRGQLDYLFSWPVNSQFMASLGRHIYSDLGTGFSGFCVLLYALKELGLIINIWTWLSIIVAIFCGVAVFYSIMLAIVTLSLFATRLSSVKSAYDVFSNVLRFPTSAFSGNNRIGELLLLPLAIIVTIPSSIFLGKLPPWYLLIEIIFSGLIFYLSSKFWSFAVRRYSSASS